MGRIKLFYTVDEDAVLKESAKIINLGADDMQHAVSLFNQVQEALRGGGSNGGPTNVTGALEMIEEFRGALLNVDTRLEEVTAIIEGYEEYKRAGRRSTPIPPRASAFQSSKTEGDGSE